MKFNSLRTDGARCQGRRVTEIAQKIQDC
jgi:hypothetical protein